MVRKYTCWMMVALFFALVSACSGNDVSTMNSQGNPNNEAADTGGLEDTSDTPEDVQEDTSDLCALVDCFENSSCDSELGQCVCNAGYNLGTDEDGNTTCLDQCMTMRCGPGSVGCEAGVCLCADDFEMNVETGACESVATGLCKEREEPCQEYATCEPETGECVCNAGYDLGIDDEGNATCMDRCRLMRCGPNTAGCEAGVCLCAEGYERVEGQGCVPVATGLCKDREEPCQEDATCDPETGECVCDFGEQESEGEESTVPVCKGICDAMRCAANSTCDPDLGACVCNEGFEMVEGEGCKAIGQGLCAAVAGRSCPANASCDPQTGECACDDLYMDVSEPNAERVECRHICEMMRCAVNSQCDLGTGTCVCNEGFEMVEGQGCMPV